MKILVVCQYYYPEPFRISDICEELASRGHSVTVLTGVPNYPMGYIYDEYKHGKRRQENINGVEVKRCFTIGRRHGAIWRFLNYYSFNLSSKHAVGKLAGDYDAVFVNQLSPVMMAEAGIKYAKKHNVPLLMYCLDLWPESLCTGGIRKGSFVYNIFHKISAKIYRSCDRILMTSRGFEKYLTGEFNIDFAKLSYLPQYAEDLFGDETSAIEKKDSGIDLVFAGNVGSAQRVDVIIRAAAKLEKDTSFNCDVRWHIVGDGSELSSCRALAQELGTKSVIFHGRHPVEEMPSFYSMADAMLLTLDNDEIISYTLPGKLQSYMVAGKAVIASADGETPRVIADADCGLCVPSDDYTALAGAVISFCNLSKPKRAQLGTNAKKYYSMYFNRQHFMDSLERELQTVKSH